MNYPQWWQLLRRPLISLFIAFNIYAAFAMACPKTWPYKKAMLVPIYPFLASFGIYHYLPLYSPNPFIREIHIDFIVTFDNGQQINWQYPRQRLAFWDPPHTFQRYVQQYLWWDRKHPKVFKNFAKFVAQQNNSINHHPTLVQFRKSEYRILLPADGPSLAHKATLNSSIFFTYRVSPRNLHV